MEENTESNTENNQSGIYSAFLAISIAFIAIGISFGINNSAMYTFAVLGIVFLVLAFVSNSSPPEKNTAKQS